ncbi:unnamed protein product [Phytomonas sp. EM1]|nr:unnamed protein product [Phytomonas sp. EM1]|eukprot:CCW60015.1 unnamed protein product [Phytomonas sp. isolate EM1]
MENLNSLEQVTLTREYIKKHRLNELFAHFLKLLLYHLPEDPRGFLCKEITKIRDEKTRSSFFNEKDLETMFELIDVTRQKFITEQQLWNTCRNLSMNENEDADSEQSSSTQQTLEQAIANAVDENGHVTLEKFKEVVSMSLLVTNVSVE